MEQIVQEAQQQAEDIVQRAQEEALNIQNTTKQKLEEERAKAEEALEKKRFELEEYEKEKKEEIEKIRAQQELELEKIKTEAQAEVEKARESLEKSIYEQIYNQVTEQAHKDSLEDIDRVITKVQKVLDEAIRQRTQVFAEVEDQITQLVLLISKKVVKSLSELDENVVVRNVVEALKNLKGRENFVIRVNLKDIKHLKKSIKYIEEKFAQKSNITFVEDSKVDPGGCVIETEFGEVDARISTQLQKIEQSIREAVPIRHA